MKEEAAKQSQVSYEGDLAIDRDSLDNEWLDQPQRFFRYSELLAKAQRRLDRAKETRDVVEAKLDRKVRQSPSVYGIPDRATESAIKNAVLLEQDFKTASTEVIDAEYKVNLLIGAVRAFTQRRDALENLVRLHGQSYFAAPREGVASDNPEEQRKMREVVTEGVHKRVGDRLNRRRLDD